MTWRSDTVRILICEDSAAYAAGLVDYIQRDADLSVVGRVADASNLIAALHTLQPDLLTMDLELPGMGGLEAVRRVMATDPLPIVVLSAHTERGSALAAAALGAGAIDVQPKAELRIDRADSPAAAAFRRRLKRLAHARVGGVRRVPRRIAPVETRGRVASVVALCASTGGPPAVCEVLGRLPPDFPLPVLVAQHISTGFAAPFARWLDGTVALPVRMASDGALARPGVWVAPDHGHLQLGRGLRMSVADGRGGHAHMPSADVLLRSVAAAAGRLGAGVVLTGMGRDGAEGTAALRAAGGLTIVQDEATSAIFGMPRAAAERGAELVLPLHEIADVLLSLPTRSSR